MHKQGAVLAQAAQVRPGDKIPFGGRGPWPRVTGIKQRRNGQVVLETKRGKLELAPSRFLRVVRK